MRYISKVIKATTSKVYYHGRTSTRPYSGKGIYITDDIDYARTYGQWQTSGGRLLTFEMPFSPEKLFSIKNKSHVAALKRITDPQAVDRAVRDSGTDELDWSVLGYLGDDRYETGEEMIESLGFYGIKLRERPGIESIFVFDESKLKKVGETKAAKEEEDYSLYTDESGQFWGNAGAGGVFYAEDTGNICLQKRSKMVNEPNTWGTWGGAIDEGESPEAAMKREVKEEAAYTGKFTLEQIFVFKKGKFRFFNYLICVPHEFEPKHSWETSDHIWTPLNKLPSPLHFGFQELLPHLKRALT